MRKISFDGGRDVSDVAPDVTPDDTQQQSTFDTGVNKLAPNTRKLAFDGGQEVPSEPDWYVFKGDPNNNAPVDISLAEKAWQNFSMTKDMIEADMWKGMRVAQFDDETTVPGQVAKALTELAGEDFIPNRIKKNELDVQEAMNVLRPYATEKDSELNFIDALVDPGHFFSVQLPRVVGGMAGLMAEPIVAGAAAGAATWWAGGSGAAAGFVGGIASMLSSRPFESIAEAQGAYQEAYDLALKNSGGDVGIAKDRAIKAFHHTYNENMKLAVADAAEVILALSPVSKIVSPAAARSAIAANRRLRVLSKVGKLGAITAKESAEEGYQHIAQAEGQNIAAGEDIKKTGWAELFYDEGEEGKEFRTSVKGGALGGLFMTGAFASVPKIMQTLGMMGRDINDKDVATFMGQQENMRIGMVARAMLTDQLPELEGRITRFGRQGALNKNHTPGVDETEQHKNSVQEARTVINQIREMVTEFEAVRPGLKKVKDDQNMIAALHNTTMLEKAKKELRSIKEDDTTKKERFDELMSVVKLREEMHEQFKTGKDVFRTVLKKRLISNEELLNKPEAEKPTSQAEAKPGEKKKSSFTPRAPKREVTPEDREEEGLAKAQQDLEKEADQKPDASVKEMTDTTERRKVMQEYRESRIKDEQEKQATIDKLMEVETPLLSETDELPEEKRAAKTKVRNDETDSDAYDSDINVARLLEKNNLLTNEEKKQLKEGESGNEIRNMVARGRARLDTLADTSDNPDLKKAAKELRVKIKPLIETSISKSITAAHRKGLENKEGVPILDQIDSMTLDRATNMINQLTERVETEKELMEKAKGKDREQRKLSKANYINQLEGLIEELKAHAEKKKAETGNQTKKNVPPAPASAPAPTPVADQSNEKAPAKSQKGKADKKRKNTATKPAQKRKVKTVEVTKEKTLEGTPVEAEPVSSSQAGQVEITPEQDLKKSLSEKRAFMNVKSKLTPLYYDLLEFFVTAKVDKFSASRIGETKISKRHSHLFITIKNREEEIKNQVEGLNFSEQELAKKKIEIRLKLPEEGAANVVKTTAGDFAFQYAPDGPLRGPRLEIYADGTYIGTINELHGPTLDRTRLDKVINSMEALLEEAKKNAAKSNKKAKEAGPLNEGPYSMMFGVPVNLKKVAVKMKPMIDELIVEIMEGSLTALQIAKKVEVFADDLFKKGEIDKRERNAIVRFLRKMINAIYNLADKIRRMEKDGLSAARELHQINQLTRAITTNETLAEAFRDMVLDEEGSLRFKSEEKYLQLTEKVRKLYDWTYRDKETDELIKDEIRDKDGYMLEPDEVYGKIFYYIHNNFEKADLLSLADFFKGMPDKEIGNRLSQHENKDLLSLWTVVISSTMVESQFLSNFTGKWQLHLENGTKSSRDRVNQLKAAADAAMNYKENPDYDKQFEADFDKTIRKERIALEALIDKASTPKTEKLKHAEKWYDLVTEFLSRQSGISKDVWMAWAKKLADDKGYNMYEKLITERKSVGIYKLLISDVLYDSNSKYEAFKTPADRFRTWLHKGYVTKTGRISVLKTLSAAIASTNTEGLAMNYRGVDGNMKTSAQFRSELTDLLNRLKRGKTEVPESAETILVQYKKGRKTVTKKVRNQFIQNVRSGKLKPEFILFGGFKNAITKAGVKQNELSEADFLLTQLHMFAQNRDGKYFSFVQQQADDSSKYFVEVEIYDTQSAKDLLEEFKDHPEIPTNEQIQVNIDKVRRILEPDAHLLKKAVEAHGMMSGEKMAELFVYNDIVNRFFLNEFLTPKFGTDAKGNIVENYQSSSKASLRELGKRKQDMKGMSLLKEIVGKSIRQIIITDPNELVVLGKDDPATARSFNEDNKSPITDGTILISESLAERANESLGGILDMKGTFKFSLTHHDEGGVRTLDKANFITLTEKFAKAHGGFIEQLYNKMNDKDNPVDIIAFESGVKMKNPSQVVKLDWVKVDGKTTIDQASLDSIGADHIIELPTEALRMQVDLQRNPVLSDRKAPHQVFYHLRDLENWKQIQDIRNQLMEVLEGHIRAEFLDRPAEEKRMYLKNELPVSEQTASLIETLSVSGVSMANSKVREAYNTAVKQIITRKMLGLLVNGSILIDMPNLTGEELGDMMRATGREVAEFNSEKANPGLQLKKGDTRPPGALVPKAFNTKNGIKVGEYIFVTRVPVSGKHSHTLVRVEGFIEDESLGNVIKTNSGVQKIAGADNDGDVRYIWARYHNLDKPFSKKLAKEVLDNINRLTSDLKAFTKQTANAKAKLESYQKAFSNLSYDLKQIVREAVDKHIKNSEKNQGEVDNTIVNDILKGYGIDPMILETRNPDELDDVEREQYDDAVTVAEAVDELLTASKATNEKIQTAKNQYNQAKGRQQKAQKALTAQHELLTSLQAAASNKIFDLMAEEWMKPGNRDAITDPIETDSISREGSWLYDLIQSAKSRLKVYDLSSVLKHMSDAQEGEKVIGILARANAAYGFLREGKMKIRSKLGPANSPGIHLPQFTYDKQTGSIVAGDLTTLSKFDHSENPDKQKRVLQVIANNLNHSVDNVKYGMLSFLGLNRFTASLKSVLLFMGMEEEHATFMMHHPIMKALVETDKQKRSPLNNERRRSTFNEQAVEYAKEFHTYVEAPMKKGELDEDDPINKIQIHGLWAGKRNINTSEEALNHPPTAKDWNLSAKEFNDVEDKAEQTEIFNSRIKVLKYIQALRGLSDEIRALGDLTRLLEEAPNGMAEVSNYNQSLEQLGYRNESTTKIEYETERTILDHGDFWNSDTMAGAKRTLILADRAASETVSGSKIGRRIIGAITRMINNSHRSKSEFMRDEDYEVAENALEKVILKVALGIGTKESYNDAVFLELRDAAVKAHAEEIQGTELGEYIKVFTDPDNEEEVFLGLDPDAKTKFTQSHQAKRLKEMFSQLSLQAKENILKYHIIKYGYNNTTEKIGGFGLLFDEQTDQMISSRMDRVLKFLQHEQNLYERSLEEDGNPYEGTYQNAITELAIATILEADELMPVGYQYGKANRVNGKIIDGSFPTIAKIVPSRAQKEAKKGFEEYVVIVEPGKSEITTTPLQDIRKYNTYNPFGDSINEDMVKAGRINEVTTVKEEELRYMKQGDGEALASTTPELVEKLRARLSKLFPNITIYNDPVKFQEYLDKHFPGEELDTEALGASIAAAIYINPDKAVQSTEAHEYVHPYYDLLPDNHIVKRKFNQRFEGSQKEKDEQAVTLIGKALVELQKRELNQEYEKQPADLIALIKAFWEYISRLFKGITGKSNEDLAMEIANELWAMSEPIDTSTQISELTYMMGTTAKTGTQRITSFLRTIASHQARIKKSSRGDSRVITTTTGIRAELTSPTTELKHHRKYLYMGKQSDPDETYTDNGTAFHSFAEQIIKGLDIDQALLESGLAGKVDKSVAEDLKTQIEQWVADNIAVNESVLNEQDVASFDYNIATRIDQLVLNSKEGKARVYDFKTSKYSTQDRKSDYFVRNLGAGKEKRSIFDRHAAQLHMEAQILERDESITTERTGIPVSEMTIVPIHLKYDSNNNIVKATIEPNIDATGNLEAKVDASEILNQKRTQGIETSRDVLLEMKSVGRDEYYASQQIPYDQMVEELDDVIALLDNDDYYEALTEDEQVNLKKRYRALQNMMDKAEAEYNQYLVDFKLAKKFISQFAKNEGNQTAEEIQAAIAHIWTFDNMAAQQAMKIINRIYANAIYSFETAKQDPVTGTWIMGDPEKRSEKDLSVVDTEIMTKGNMPEQFAEVQYALKLLQTNEQIIENDYEHYKATSLKLMRKLVEEKDREAGRKYGWVKFFNGTSLERSLYFENLIDEDHKIKEATDPSLSATEKEWIMYHQHGMVLDEKGEYKEHAHFKGYHDLVLKNGVEDKNLFYPASAMDYTEAVSKLGFFRAYTDKLFESRTAREVIVRFKDPVTGQDNEGPMIGVLKRFEEKYRQLGDDSKNISLKKQALDWSTRKTGLKVFSKKAHANKEQQALLTKLEVLIKSANKAAEDGHNLDKDGTPIKRSFRESGFIMREGMLKPFDGNTSRYFLDRTGRLMSKADRRLTKDTPISSDLFATYNASVYDRIYTRRMRDVLPEVLAVKSFFEQKRIESLVTDKPLYKNFNKWFDTMFRKDILQEKFTHGKVVDTTFDKLRWLTYARIMTFNVPVAIANVAVGFFNTMVNIGIRKWMKGLVRYAGNLPKARAFLNANRLVSVPHQEDFGNGALKGFMKLANKFTLEAEMLIQGANILAYLTDEQWENYDESGEVKDAADYEARLTAIEEDVFATDAQREKAIAYFKQNYLTAEDTARLKKMKNDIQGHYDIRDQGNYARFSFFKAIMMFKTWMPAVIKIHFGEHTHDIFGQEMKGIFRSAHDQIRVWLKLEEEGKLTEIDKVNMKKLMREAGLLMTAFGLHALAFDDDDDDEVMKFFKNYTKYILNQMMPISLSGAEQFFKSQAAPLTTLANILDAIQSMLSWERYKIDGAYGEKGDLKFPGKVWKLLPYNSLYNPTSTAPIPARILAFPKYKDMKVQ